MVLENQQLFTPNLGPFIVAGRHAVSGLNDNPGGMPRTVSSLIKTYQGMSPEKQEFLKQTGQAVLQKAKDSARNTKTRLYGNSNVDSDAGSSGGGSTSYGLSPAPNPMPVSLNTGIEPNTYVTNFLQTIENKCSPLHLTGVNLKVPTTVGTTLLNYFNSVIAFDFQKRAQAAVTFNINVSSKFTAATILTGMNAILDALQVYYWYASILTYGSSPINQNAGMIYLRSKITAADIQNFYLLKNRLEGTPIPPNMLSIVRYLSSNWFSGDTQGSTLIKIAPKAMTADGIASANLTSALTALDTDANNEVFSIIRKCAPGWMTALPDVPLFPAYDSNFVTVWGNLPFLTWNGTITAQYPAALTTDTAIDYCSWTNSLDGFAFALNSIYNAASHQPGFVTPIAGHLGSNRYSYYSVSGITGLYDANKLDFLVKSRAETYYVSNTTTLAVSSGHLPGTDKCQGVCITTILENSLAAIKYIMSSEHLSAGSSESADSTSKSSAAGKRRRKRK